MGIVLISLTTAEAYMKFLVREKWARKEWWEELIKEASAS
jgi:hypothetical protein